MKKKYLFIVILAFNGWTISPAKIKKSLNSYGYENNSYDSTYLREEYPPEYSPVPFN